MNHIAKVRAAFEKQASSFNDSKHTIGSHEIMDWIVATVNPSPDDRMLDVAAGTALLGRALAKKVKMVTAVDATSAMLDVGKAAAAEEAINNIEFAIAEAEKLPFPDGHFSLVVSRLSLHHFVRPAVNVGEMCRVCEPHGRVIIIDLVSPPNPRLRKSYNDLEQKRDPSHTCALTEKQLLEIFNGTGKNPTIKDVKVVEVDFKKWVELTKTPVAVVEKIRAPLFREIEGGEKTGFEPHMVDGNLKFHQHWAIVEAGHVIMSSQVCN